MKKLVTALCVLVFLEYMVCINCRAAQTDPGRLYARGACLMDGDSGRILYGKNETQEMAMASTTKIMTCILILENCDLTETVIASQNAVKQPKVRLGVQKGQRFLLKDLLYALMLESYNDAAVMLAEHLDGSVNAFARRMNEKAKELGCENTYFITPNGLDAKDAKGTHHTTAADLVVIMRYCTGQSLQAKQFLAITQKENHSFSDLEGQMNYSCINHNQFFRMTKGVLSGKTGFTNNAGYCYVCAVKSEGRTFVIALLGCGWPGNKTWKWKDALTLLQYGKENYRLHTIVPLQFEAEIPAEGAVYEWGEKRNPKVWLTEVPEKSVTTVLLGKEETIRATYRYVSTLEAPAAAGMDCGEVRYWLGGQCIKKSRIQLKQDVYRVSLLWCFRQVFLHFVQLIITV